MSEILIMFGLFWWIYLVALFGIIIFFIEDKSGFCATVTTILGLIGLEILGNTPVWDTIIHRPYYLIPFVAGYLFCGVVWSLIKWRLFIGKKHAQYVKYKETFCQKNSIPFSEPFTQEQKVSFNRYLLDHSNYFTDKNGIAIVRPYASNNKSLITMWMIWWVPSLVWTITHDFILGLWDNIKALFNYIREFISGYMEAMSIKRFRDSENDLK